MAKTSYSFMTARPYDSLLRWLVPSTTRRKIEHLVDLGEQTCSCEDHEFRKRKCRHFIHAERALLEVTIETLKRHEQNQIQQ